MEIFCLLATLFLPGFFGALKNMSYEGIILVIELIIGLICYIGWRK